MKRAKVLSTLVNCAVVIGALLLSFGSLVTQDQQDPNGPDSINVQPYNPNPPSILLAIIVI
jgi:hypothetical protein